MKLTVATIQMTSYNNDFRGNCARAEDLIDQAVKKGAQLILLPEFALAGYTFEDGIWDMAEPLKGRTYQWLRSLCARHKVYIGTCILEANGNDFYDTFILAGPGQDELWQHRKIEPASYEAFFFKGGGKNTSVFKTPLGRIGVAICFDTSKNLTLAGLKQGRPDVVLIPYSCPELPWFCLPQDRKAWVDLYMDTPKYFARRFNVPVVTSNKTGNFDSPIPWVPGLTLQSDFLAYSSITERSGKILSKLRRGQGVLVEEIEIGPEEVPKIPLPEGRWFLPYSWSLKLMMDASFMLGRLRYRLSPGRRRAVERVTRK